MWLRILTRYGLESIRSRISTKVFTGRISWGRELLTLLTFGDTCWWWPRYKQVLREVCCVYPTVAAAVLHSWWTPVTVEFQRRLKCGGTLGILQAFITTKTSEAELYSWLSVSWLWRQSLFNHFVFIMRAYQ